MGTSGTILHSVDRGATWQVQPSGTNDHLSGIWGDSPTNIWIVGDWTLLRRQ